MGFLKRFFKNVFRDGSIPIGGSSFDQIPRSELEAHLNVVRYGSFVLPDAIRPSFDLKVVPIEGYRHDHYHDEQTGASVPVIMSSVSREKLFETFLELLDPLGSVVDVVLETSHNREKTGHTDLYREHIDMPVLKSILYDFEDILVNDGCTGIAVLNPLIPQEIQLDEHKLLIVYGEELEAYETILKEHRIPCNEQLHFLTEAEHVHSSKDTYVEMFNELKTDLGMDGDYF
ncbi:MAG: hypothetical protein LBQ54_07330 [Planctomycetaceae bacterium]|jgi:hypothetical protein|nr:hypothetical protein [Planctomycetaceae bacterium]